VNWDVHFIFLEHKFKGLFNGILYIEFEEKLLLKFVEKVFNVNIVSRHHILSNVFIYYPPLELLFTPFVAPIELIKEFSYICLATLVPYCKKYFNS